MEEHEPIDIHYIRFEEWLKDRETVLIKKDKNGFHELMQIAPRIVQLAKVEMPILRKQLNRLETQTCEFSRRVDDSFHQESTLKRKTIAFLERFGLLPNSVVNLCSKSPTACGGSDAVLDKRSLLSREEELRYESAEVIIKHLEPILCARLEDTHRSCVLATHTFAANALSGCFACFEAYINKSMHLSGAAEGDSISIRSMFPTLSCLERSSRSMLFPETADNFENLAEEIVSKSEEQPTAGTCSEEPTIFWDDEFTENAPTISIDWGGEDSISNADETTRQLNVNPPNPHDGTVLSCALSTIPDMIQSSVVRCHLIDELEALKSFMVESSAAGQTVVGNALSTPSIRRHHLELSSLISDLVKVLQDPISVELLRMKCDLKARNAFVDSCFRCRSAVKTVENRRAAFTRQALESSISAADLQKRLNAIMKEIKFLQTRCEETLMTICHPRPVYIVGDINNL